MARGFIRGMLWGAGVSLGAVTLISVVVEGPQPPAGTDTAQRNTVVAGETVETPPRSLGDGIPVAVAAGVKSPPPQPDTLAGLADTALTPAAAPQTGRPSDLQGVLVPDSTALSGIATPQTKAPRVTYAETGSLTTPSAETGVSVSVDPAQPLPPEPVTETSAFAEAPAAPEVIAPETAAPSDDSAPSVLTEVEAPAAPLTAQIEMSISVDPAQPDLPDVPVASGAFDAPVVSAIQSPTETATLADALPTGDTDAPAVMATAPEIDLAALAPKNGSAPVTILSDEAPQVTAAVQEPETVPDVGTAAPDVSAEPKAPALSVVSDLTAPDTADATQEAGESVTARVQAKPVVNAPELQDPGETEVKIVAAIAPAPTQQPAKPLPKIDVNTAADVSDAVQQSAAPVVRQATPKTVRVNRLPTLGGAAEAPAEVALPELEQPFVLENVKTDADQRPVDAFSVAVENPDDKPVMAVVLLDEGTDIDAKSTGLATLRDLPYPVSFAVDAMLPDASERMAAYRRAGFEVLAMIDLPEGSTAMDAEINLSVALKAVPQAVGVMEGIKTGIQTTPDAGRQVAQILSQTGHGLVTQNQGLNTVQKLAARQGVPSAVIFRDFDGKGQDAKVIRRFMDQAAFRAGQEGGVIMLGRLREETLSALLLWTLQDRASSVAMVPVSAALRTQ